MRTPRVSLEQWRTLLAVVEHGGFAQAAKVLHRSQSSISYTIAKLQEQLGLPLLKMSGRKAELNEAGEVILQRARQLLLESGELEELAHHLQAGREAEIQLVVDAALPRAVLFKALKNFACDNQGTRVQLREVILSGADDLLNAGEADIAVAAQVPKGFLGDKLMEVDFIAVAHPDHPLHQIAAPLTLYDLRTSMQVVIRDSGLHHQQDVGWLDSEHRWTVTSIEAAAHAIQEGLGFGWIPRHHIEAALKDGTLKPLAIETGAHYIANLYLIFGNENSGPATRQLAEALRKAAGN
ncbi:MAG: LysR family transcriptional regulator [Gammaproteobacteria bacterium]